MAFYQTLQQFDPNLILWLGLYVFMAVLIWRTTKLQPIVLYMQNALEEDNGFSYLPGAGAVEEIRSVCVWCGIDYPKPVDDENPEPAWYIAKEKWVMYSKENGDVLKMACCEGHMIDYIVLGKT